MSDIVYVFIVFLFVFSLFLFCSKLYLLEKEPTSFLFFSSSIQPSENGVALKEEKEYTSTLQSVFAVSCFKREFGVLWPKTNKRELDKNEKYLKKIEKRLDFLSVNSAFWGPKLIRIYSRQIRIGEYTFYTLISN